MKQHLTTLFLLCTSFLAGMSQTYISHRNGQISQTASNEKMSREIIEDEDGYTIKYSIACSKLEEAPSNLGYWPSIDGFSYIGSAGKPQLPFRYDEIKLPLGSSAEVILTDLEYVDVNLKIAPSQYVGPEIPNYRPDSIKPLDLDGEDCFLPHYPVTQGIVTEFCKQNTQRIEITPILYNPISGKARLYSSFTYKVKFTQSSRQKVKPVPIPPDTIPKPFPPSMSPNKPADEGYLIISIPSLEYELNRFAQWKRILGFNVDIVTQPRWTSDEIKSTVQAKYDRDNSIKYLLLVGNNNDVPGMRRSDYKVVMERDNKYSGGDSIYYTDLYYGCMGGVDDTTPDIHRGRWATSDYQQVQNIVDKIIWYESQPVEDSIFYRKSAHCAYFQYHPSPSAGHDFGSEGYRFVQTSEDVKNYLTDSLSHHGIHKEPSTIYWIDPSKRDDNRNLPPISWSSKYGPFGAIPPQTIAELQKDKSFEDLYDEIHDGRHYVLYRGHGVQTHLISQMSAKPNFDIKKASSLRNAEWQPVFFSICCSSGDYSDRCFAQSLLDNESGGAVGVIAASHTGYPGHDDVLTMGLFNSIWPEPGLSPRIIGLDPINFSEEGPEYRLGAILDRATNVTEKNYVMDRVTGLYTKEIFHCFGDPSMMFFTEVPSEYDFFECKAYEDYISVILQSEKAYISFYDHVTGLSKRFYGQYANYYTDHPENVSFCIAGHNHIPHIVYGEDYTPTGGEIFERPNKITACHDMDGVLTIDYRLDENVKNAYIVVVDLYNNWFCAQIPCNESSGSVGAHVGFGVYAVSLMVNDYPADTVRTIVSHSNR